MMNVPAPIHDVDFDQVKVDPAWALRIPTSLAIRRRVLPFASMNQCVYVASPAMPDEATLEALRRFTGQAPCIVLVAEDALQRALARVYGDGQSRGTMPILRADLQAANQDDVIALVDDLIRAALLRQASDIHVDPERDRLRLRLRADGILEDFYALPLAMHPPICSRLKVLAGMDIAERRAPQDGAFTFRFGTSAHSQAIDIRVASLPIKHGERLTLRLLAAQDRSLGLEQLGLDEQDVTILRKVLDQPQGLVLLTGPTGSGKTTTLYAAIRHLLQGRPLNILTVEDPIEYEIEGVAQAEVDSADKVSFSKALRSLLRHDPDVVMIGEIRDAESLDIAIKASLTGHLVLSTLHTNNAVSVVTRLLDMGLAPHLLAATLRLSVAQRLVRRLCPHCRQAQTLAEAEAQALRRPALAGRLIYQPQGCIYCAGRGFAGRMGVFECYQPDAETAAWVASGITEGQLTQRLKDKGFHTLMDDAIAKACQGLTTIGEVLEVVSEF